MKRHGSADVFVTDKLRSYCVVPCWLVALQSPAGQWMKDAMTAQMVTDALMMAIWGRGRPKELLHHSDQGSQYTSEAV
jgi:hypothetical protein